MRFVDLDGDGSIDTDEFVRLGRMQDELERLGAANVAGATEVAALTEACAQLEQQREETVVMVEGVMERQRQAQEGLREAYDAVGGELATTKAAVATATAERDAALVTIAEQTDAWGRERSELIQKGEASREQVAGMFEAVQAQHAGLEQLRSQLAAAEGDLKATRNLLDASCQAAEKQRMDAASEADRLRLELGKATDEWERATEEAQLAAVALTAAMDVVEQCRLKVSPHAWAEINAQL